MAEKILKEYLTEFITGLPQWQDPKPTLVDRGDWPDDMLRVSDDVIGRDAVALGIRTEAIFVGYRMVPGGDMTDSRFAILEINHTGAMTVNFCERLGNKQWDYRSYKAAPVDASALKLNATATNDAEPQA